MKNERDAASVSRRDLIKGSAFIAAGLAAAGGLSAIGCASQQQGAASTNGEAWDQETDVIVVGYGGAGACAAIEAADNGAAVVVIEKQAEDAHLSDTAMSMGNFHCPDAGADTNALKLYYRALASGDGAPGATELDYPSEYLDGVVDSFVTGELEIVEFLEKMDPDFDPVQQAGLMPYSNFPGSDAKGFRIWNPSFSGKLTEVKYPDPHMPKENSIGGLALMNCLKNGVADRSGAIEVIYEAPASELITDETGDVIGVVAVVNGSPKRIKANKGVVLAAGGYEFSEKLRDSFTFGPAETGYAFYGSPDNTGDGVLMALKAGAMPYRSSKHIGLKYIWKCPDVTVGNLAVGARTDAVGSEGTIIVDSLGKRFINESSIFPSFPVSSTTFSFDHTPAYLILDDDRLQQGALVNLSYGSVGFGVVDWKDDGNQDALSRGWIYKGDTIEDLAAAIAADHAENGGRMSGEVLAATLDRYNSVIVPAGVDEDFGRTTKTSFKAIEKGPFYALPVYAGGAGTTGPLVTDEAGRVLDWDRQPIGRLYAAGEMASMWLHCHMPGCNISECIVRGRLAGRAVAAEAGQTAE